MPVSAAFKLLMLSYKNKDVIRQLEKMNSSSIGDELKSIIEFGQEKNCIFNESELILTTCYFQSKENKAVVNVFDNYLSWEDKNNRYMLEEVILSSNECLKNPKPPHCSMIIALTEVKLLENDWGYFLDFIEESESDGSSEIPYPLKNPVELMIDLPSSERRDSEIDKIERKWNICKEIIIEVLQEEE
jgi:hypothetical protein